MYSVMLMMAMTSGGDLPNLGHHGCCGGYSGGYSSCCGGSWGGGYSCCGGGYVSSCCCGGYYGGSSCCGGGYSSCCGGGRHRLFGGHHSSCCGGYSSCCGGYGGYSCCGGYYGGSSCCGGGMMYGPGTVIEEKKPEEIKTKPETKPETLVPAPATIIVSLPADAKLSIDDAATISTSSMRVFTSPELPVGQDYHYTLKAEYVRDGKPVVRSKDITVRAGEQTRVNLEAPSGVASR